jgi:putative thioredoxin
MLNAQFSHHVTMDNAKQVLIDASYDRPVVIDFWADWCEPCKTLMPMLDKLVQEYQGAFHLAKVNCDEQREIAAQFGVQSLPTVMIVKDGQPVDGFAGAQPESIIRELLDKYLPKPEDLKFAAAAHLLEAGDPNGAIIAAKEAFELAPQRSDIRFILVECQLELAKIAEAEALLLSTPLADQNADFHALKSQLELAQQTADTPEIRALEAQLGSAPDDITIKYQLALQYGQAGRHEEALALLFGILSKNLDALDGQIKKSFLDMLTTLSGDPIASSYRRRFFSLLY